MVLRFARVSFLKLPEPVTQGDARRAEMNSSLGFASPDLTPAMHNAASDPTGRIPEPQYEGPALRPPPRLIQVCKEAGKSLNVLNTNSRPLKSHPPRPQGKS